MIRTGTKFFLDTEFIEDGKTIELISIGIVREGGLELYMECANIDWSKANDWVLKNVKPHIKGPFYSKEEIAFAVKNFVGNRPEFWAYFADYDWVVLCQLYGRMIDLPPGWPMLCLDIKQYMYHLSVERSDLPVQDKSTEHAAIADARWNLQAYQALCDIRDASRRMI